MTTPTGLELVWADSGGTTDPGDFKYQLGWVAEIPTYQNFNHVLQSLDKAKLSYAEADVYPWQDLIAYAVGARVDKAGIRYTCVTAHNDIAGSNPQDPALDNTNSYWVTGISLSARDDVASGLNQEDGLKLDRINERATTNLWESNDVTIQNKSAVIALNSTTVAHDNYLLTNVQGKVAVVNVGAQVNPDGVTSLLPSVNPNAYELFHEGHPPTQSEVAGTIPSNPVDSKIYGRRDNNWIDLGERQWAYDSVADMVAGSSELSVGDLVRTKGYYSNTGKGGANYVVIAGNTGDGYRSHDIGSNTALLKEENVVGLEQVGLAGDYYLENGSVNPSPTDDTDALKAALLVGGSLIGNSTSSYLITQWAHANVDSTKIDFQGAKLVWANDGTNINPPDARNEGVISFKGEEVNKVEYTVGVTADTSEIIVAGTLAADIVAGVYIKFSTINSYPTNDGRAHYDYLAKVLDVQAGAGFVTITTEERHRWSFSGQGYIGKVVPMFDSGVKNVRVVDTTSTSHENATCGFNANLTVGFSAYSVDMDNQFNPVFTVYSSRDTIMIKGDSKEAVATTGGRGYYVQFGGCRNVLASELQLTRGRHIVDFTSCARGLVSNCHGEDNSEAEFSFHGEWEHDISVENCTGSVSVAISGEQFGEMAQNIRIRRVVGNFFFNYRNAYDVTVEDSSFEVGSTNTFNLALVNSRFTEYIRFAADSVHPFLPDITSKANVFGGYVKGEDYQGADFIPEGAIVDFHGTTVDTPRVSSSTAVNLHRLKMNGGRLIMGFAQPVSSGTWSLHGTKLDDVCFVFEDYIRNGFRLELDNVECTTFNATGLIRNRISSAGIRDINGSNQSPSNRATLVIKNTKLKPDVPGGRTIDLDQPKYCLNVDIDSVEIEDGDFTADLRVPSSDVGKIKINILEGEGFTGGITREDEYKHRDRLVDLDTELGFEGQSAIESDNPQSVKVFLLDHFSTSSGFLAYNYPEDDQAKGLLIVTSTPGNSAVMQEIIYSFSTGAITAGDRWSRVARFGTFTPWVKIA